MQIMGVALEDRVGGKGNEDVKIAGRAAMQSRLAFARQPDSRAFFDARRNVDGEGTFFLYMRVAAARLAGIAYDATAAVAARAGALDGEEALLRAHFARARAGGAVLGL